MTFYLLVRLKRNLLLILICNDGGLLLLLCPLPNQFHLGSLLPFLLLVSLLGQTLFSRLTLF